MNTKKLMVQKYIKFIHKSLYRASLLKALDDLSNNTLQTYDIKVLHDTHGYKRIRIGNVRIVFVTINGKNKIVKIDNRGDIY